VYKTFVISLCNSGSGIYQYHARERFHKTSQSASKFQWQIILFDAVNGYTLDQTIWHTLNLQKPKAPKNKEKLTFGTKPGALGCFLSHYYLWRKCADLNESIIVLEDDADIIRSPTTISTSSDVVKLHSPRQKKYHPVTGEWSPCTTAYFLTPMGASKLLDFVHSTGPKYADKLIASNIVAWNYIDVPLINIRREIGSSTNPIAYPYASFYQ